MVRAIDCIPLLTEREFEWAEGREEFELIEPTSKREAGAEPVERTEGLKCERIE